MIAEVIVDIAVGETDRIFDYLCDDSVAVGSRVRAPFGGKILPGFVMRKKETSDYPMEKLKKVIPYDDELPALSQESLALAEKLTARYRVPKALTLRLFLPAGMRTGKVRELMRNYAQLLVPVQEMKLVKSAKKQIGAAQYLEEHGKTECAYLNNLFPGGVSALEKKGYVRRHRDEQDGRRWLVEPTDRAYEMLPLFSDVLSDVRELLTRDLSHEEQELFGELIQKMARNAARRSAQREGEKKR